MVLENVLIVDPIDGEYVGTVEFEERIYKVLRTERSTYKSILMPGFIDPHIHGVMGIDTMHASKLEFEKFKEYEALEGVWYFLPTTVTCQLEKLSKIEIPEDLKFHIEGPFISKKRKGAHDESYIVSPPADVIEMERYVSLDKIKIITVAPETETFSEFAKSCSHQGIRVSLGHSNANFETAKKSFDYGYRRITHFPNALSQIHHRDLGMVGAGLYLDFTVELIADGIHTCPEFVDFVYRIKRAQRIILITDSISATGMKDGYYILGELPVKVVDGKAQLEDGTIAGSTLRFSEAVKNFQKFTGCRLRELAIVSSYNSALDLGIEGGRIKEGYPAKLVELDGDLNIVKTWNF
ncbi:MAG: N-acetylglucosamine-6-phosphate deacetylase [Fervidobacterium sp.]|nr:N-acetylglucosamine-6-phosphate deacetylase [Fervidobacterium sp.]